MFPLTLPGFKTLEKSYLLRVHGKIVERPQHMIMRAACGIHCGDLRAALETYDLMSRIQGQILKQHVIGKLYLKKFGQHLIGK